jgi:hypothetical protein
MPARRRPPLRGAGTEDWVAKAFAAPKPRMYMRGSAETRAYINPARSNQELVRNVSRRNTF